MSSSHKLTITKMDTFANISPIELKECAEDTEIFGRDFILQYHFVTDTFIGSLISHQQSLIDIDYYENNNDDFMEDTISHHLIISTPENVSSFKRTICFLIERSPTLLHVWDAIRGAISHSLSKLQEDELFSVLVFPSPSGDEYALPLSEEFMRPTKENKERAIAWLKTYGPEKIETSLEKPLYTALKQLNTKAPAKTFQVLVVIGASQYKGEQNEREIMTKMSNFHNQRLSDIDDNNSSIIKQRIFTVSIGNGVNRYLMKFLSSISRGKSIHITNPLTVEDELISFFNEFRNPLCSDLKINVQFLNNKLEFNAEEMLHPYPITDLYTNNPIVLKLTVPNRAEYKIGQVTITAFCANLDTEIEITVITEDYDNNKQIFPMQIALAQSHLDALHSQIWKLDSLDADSALQTLTQTANEISDNVGLSSPTRILHTSEEKYECDEEEKQDLNLLSLPPRIGKAEMRRRTRKVKKNRAAAIGAIGGAGAVYRVIIIHTFGGDAGIFGGVEDAIGDIACCENCDVDCCYSEEYNPCDDCVVL